ncbi:hypothetical protein BDN70DRAFT_881524 [Pholiota conissans]|uniref:Uncharacterized protein n=1 Tax=Pholiota conissans TaxID=109636 RepID=A0A9P5YXA5_9AGAR|nr:hypothetical protein BDN70DRAFT_881524 [Pholiota conissans]
MDYAVEGRRTVNAPFHKPKNVHQHIGGRILNNSERYVFSLSTGRRRISYKSLNSGGERRSTQEMMKSITGQQNGRKERWDRKAGKKERKMEQKGKGIQRGE